MARVVVLNDHPDLIDMLGSPLVRAGHRVLDEASPLDLEEILRFGPDVLVVGVSRKPGAVGHPIPLPPEELWGYHAVVQLESEPVLALVPMIVVGVGVFEPEFPLKLPYDLFLTFPDDMRLYGAKVAELATLVKTRRKISGYVCPVPGCGSRLVYLREPVRDLSCPKCGVGVALIDAEHMTWCDVEGGSHEGLLADLRAPGGRGREARI